MKDDGKSGDTFSVVNAVELCSIYRCILENYIGNLWPWLAFLLVYVGCWAPIRLSLLKVASCKKICLSLIVSCMFCSSLKHLPGAWS